MCIPATWKHTPNVQSFPDGFQSLKETSTPLTSWCQICWKQSKLPFFFFNKRKLSFGVRKIAQNIHLFSILNFPQVANLNFYTTSSSFHYNQFPHLFLCQKSQLFPLQLQKIITLVPQKTTSVYKRPNKVSVLTSLMALCHWAIFFLCAFVKWSHDFCLVAASKTFHTASPNKKEHHQLNSSVVKGCWFGLRSRIITLLQLPKYP